MGNEVSSEQIKEIQEKQKYLELQNKKIQEMMEKQLQVGILMAKTL